MRRQCRTAVRAASPNAALLASLLRRFQGRYSYVGAQPALEVVAKEGHVTVLDHHARTRTVQARSHALACHAARSRTQPHSLTHSARAQEVKDPMQVCIDLSKKWKPHRDPGLPDAFCGARVCG